MCMFKMGFNLKVLVFWGLLCNKVLKGKLIFCVSWFDMGVNCKDFI